MIQTINHDEIVEQNKHIKNRDCVIDNFRGFTIVLLILFFSLNTLRYVPSYLLHALDGKILTVMDFIAPGFILAFVFSYQLGIDKFHNDYKQAIKKYVTRFFALIGVGTIYSLISNLVMGSTIGFNVFIMIGLSGLITLFFIRVNKYIKLGIGVFFILLFQLLQYIPFFLNYVINNDFGGLFGVLSYSGMMLIVMFIGTFYFEKKSFGFTLLTFIFLSISVILITINLIMKISGYFNPILISSKIRSSLTYILITLGINLFIFWVFSKTKKHLPILSWLGVNSLVLYFSCGAFAQLVTLLLNEFVTLKTGWIFMLISFSLCLGFGIGLSFILWILKKRITI